MSNTEKTQEIAASKAGMDIKTARKYLRARVLPSERIADRHWRTHKDEFSDVWPDLKEQLTANPGLEAKTIFASLQRTYPERFADGQLRTLQRKVKHWRATEGPAREVYFAQEHRPGELCESDFTYLTELGITVGGDRPIDGRRCDQPRAGSRFQDARRHADSNPQFRPDVAGIAQEQFDQRLKSVKVGGVDVGQSAGGLLNGIFGKTKK